MNPILLWIRIPRKGDMMKAIRNLFSNTPIFKLAILLLPIIIILGRGDGRLYAREGISIEHGDKLLQAPADNQTARGADQTSPYLIGNTDRLSITFIPSSIIKIPENFRNHLDKLQT